MSFFKNIFNKTFAWHLGIVFASGILVVFFIFIGLDLYTRHGKAFEAPDFKGLTEEEFTDLIEKHDLRYAIIDSVYVEDSTPGVVLEQTPKAGSLVKKNRNIFFTINSWEPEKVQMPDVIDYSIRNARVMLESFGLEVGELMYVPSEYSNLVLGQHHEGKAIEPGTSLERGSTIDLVVGKGLSNQRTAVPHLVGLKKEAAKEVIKEVSLNIGAEIYDTTVVNKEDSAEAFVWKQNPEASRENLLQLGSSIDLWLTTDSSYIESDSVESSPLDTISRENVFIREDDSLDVDTTGTQEEEKQPETPAYPEEEDDDDGDDDDDEKFF
ncbi:MAG: PASTA domain-containing protein [Marinilabiliaceae bacterium]